MRDKERLQVKKLKGGSGKSSKEIRDAIRAIRMSIEIKDIFGPNAIVDLDLKYYLIVVKKALLLEIEVRE